MPDKSLTVATYAAGASLAAITLIYVFAPTYFLDSDPQASSSLFSSRKKGVVGLSNSANDCFINSVLQALAGLGDLRLYLIRETHRRDLDGDGSVYAQAVPSGGWEAGAERETSGVPARRNMPEWKVEGLQNGIVTKGLKDILDSLNERPIYKKTISAAPFVRTLEQAFRQRISRQQQDAQEFLQVVAERLCDEYHAGRRARRFAKRKAALASVQGRSESGIEGGPVEDKLAGLAREDMENGLSQHSASTSTTLVTRRAPQDNDEDEEEEGFPLEGKFESQIECLTCGFKPRPTESAFCSLTLNVPQVSSTTLNACFDGMFKTEYIDDFKCEKCRLLHAMAVFEAEAQKSSSETSATKARSAIAKLQLAIDTDPEKPPDGITLPDLRYAPKRRIARHIRLTRFPKIMAIHLSRSIFDASNLSQKNSAKVAFPEQLPLGGLLQQRKYKLLGLVTHKGSHHSGHYESFRRQNMYPPYSNPNTFQASGVYNKPASPASTPQIRALQQEPGDSSPLASTPDLLSPESAPNSSTLSLESAAPAVMVLRNGSTTKDKPASPSKRPGATSWSRERDVDTSSLRSVAASARSTLSKITSRPSSRTGSRDGAGDTSLQRLPPSSAATIKATSNVGTPVSVSRPKRRKTHDRWWRISDDKVKEASTRDVLGMQREVYLLFYELERGEDNDAFAPDRRPVGV
ncbi:ubiquitin c-terminal hydrolase [Diplogelasinospora grovesii]|uniref:Ubiquitin carboxyl-terminal hydrolase n=1 Tax=Diplogelasinospora grovesii TaxID=303347 RepID=A0AAN6N9R7_9PEZI|nr:ubiquitin c-terminal hydrolase [Diplogelasinospora grovesii]